MLSTLFKPQNSRRNSGKNTMKARQQLSLATHVERIRKANTDAMQKTRGTNVQSTVGGAALKVSGAQSICAMKDMTDHVQGQIASQIFHETAPTWLKATSTKRTSEYVDKITNTTYTSDNGLDRSTTEPGDSDHGVRTDTDQTSGSGSQGAAMKKWKELTEALDENTALQAELGEVKKKLHGRDEDYSALEERYKAQRAQRMRDKEILDDAFEQYQAVEDRCQDLEAEQEDLGAQLQAKDRRLATLEELHQKELASKNAKITKAKALVQEKDDELDQAVRKAAKERRDIKAKAGAEQRKLIKASKINRDAWAEEKKSKDSLIQQMAADYNDTLRAQRDEIERLARHKRSLEAENSLLFSAIHRRPLDDKQAQEFFAGAQETRKELAEMRTKYKISVEKVENVLDSMQGDRDYFTTYTSKEKEAQILASDLQKTVVRLEEKLAVREGLISDIGKQIGVSKQNRVLDQQSDTPSGTVDAINQTLSDNDDLRKQIDSVLKEKAELQSEYNKVDTENFDLLLKLDDAEAQVHKLQEEGHVIEHARAASDKELQVLRNAMEKNGNLTMDDKADLGRHLCELTEENQALSSSISTLNHELNTLRENMANAEDKMNSEVLKARKSADFWFTYFYDEAVPKVESLYKEIRQLNEELGRVVHVHESVERNVVADRAALRTACEYSACLPSTLPAEFYEPGFRPGWIPATYDALRVLRPLGWVPICDMEKVWLTPMFKPSTEEDAVHRLEACEQVERKAHYAKMGFPPPEGTSHSKINDDKGTNANTEAHQDAPAHKSTGPRPDTMMKPAPLNQGRGLLHLPWPKHAAQPTKTAKAARRNVPTVAYEAPKPPAYRSSWEKEHNMPREVYNQLQDSNKLDFVTNFVTGDGR